MIQFTIDGEPTPAGRPRFSTQGGHVRAVDPQKSRDYKSYVKMIASQYKPPRPFEGVVHLRVDIFKPIPKSFSKKKRELAEQGRILPTTKPDCSNYVKLIEDACNGIIWKDDSQIVSLLVRKWYSVNPRVEVLVNSDPAEAEATLEAATLEHTEEDDPNQMKIDELVRIPGTYPGD